LDNKKINLNLRLARIGAGLKQVELARAAKCAQPIISMIENGKLMPDPTLARRLAKALNVDANSIFPANQITREAPPCK
jgi:DNA-binding XRE family transcriptional regulator